MSEHVCDDSIYDGGIALDAVVSLDSELLILVDDGDRELGYLSKAGCHEGRGVLHRAFSLFIFNPQGQLLLQQRSETKRLWPQYWSNSCCSHPRQGESMEAAAHRRLYQELGMRCPLKHLFNFKYHAQFDATGAEHELCSVYVGCSTDTVRPNINEVLNWCWIDLDELQAEMQRSQRPFTPWFEIEWARIRTEFQTALPRPHAGSFV